MDLEIFYAACYRDRQKTRQYLTRYLISLNISGFDYARIYDENGREIPFPVPIKEENLPMLVLWPPGVTLDFSTNSRRENWAAIFSMPEIRRGEGPFDYTLETSPLRSFLPLDARKLHEVKGVFSALAGCFASGHAQAKVKAKLLFCSLLAFLIADPEENEAENTPEGALKKAIDEDVNFSLSLRELNKKINGYTPAYMRKLFLARYGILPSKYRSNLRMNRILELFAHTDMSLKMIADEVGMKHLEHLYAFLGERETLSPGELMEEFRSRKERNKGEFK